MVLVEAESLKAEQLEALRDARAMQPVFNHRGDLIIVLPEVRVEKSRKAKTEELNRWIKEAGDAIQVEGTLDRRLTLRPTSGEAEDALEIANRLHRDVSPELAQARFIRVVQRHD